MKVFSLERRNRFRTGCDTKNRLFLPARTNQAAPITHQNAYPPGMGCRATFEQGNIVG